MPRGKDKDEKKKEDLPPMASLSLSESVPSTSQEQHRVSDDEGGLGLTGGSRKKKKKTPRDKPVTLGVAGDSRSQEETKQKSEPATPQDAPSKQDPETQKRKDTKDDDDEPVGLELGLTGGRKNRRKKKKPESSAPAVSASQSMPEMPKQQPAPAFPALPSTPAPIASTWGQSKPVLATASAVPSTSTLPSTSVARLPVSAPPAQVAVPSTSQITSSGVQVADKTKVTKSTPMCLFKIPEKILGRGVPSRAIKVLANYLEMTIKPIQIYRYDVIFKPDRPKKFMPIAYNLAVNKCFSKALLAFDQRKNVYSLTALPGVPANDRLKCEVQVTDPNGKVCPIEVSFKFTGVVDLNTILTYMQNGGSTLNPPTEAIQAIDVILRQGTLESYVKAGRQFFRRPNNPINLGDGLEMWTGLFQSAIFTSRPFINIDVAHKGFPRHQLLIDAYTKDFHLDTTKSVAEQRGRNSEAFQHFLRGLKVVAYIGGDIKSGAQREFICNELVDTPRRMNFKIFEGTSNENKITVFEYFEREKNIRIRYPNMNCVWVGPKDKRIYYPMEFLHITYGQVSNKQLNESQLSTLVKESATPPIDRKKKIEEVIANMNYSKSEYFKKFGLNISNHFVSVEAKILQAPKMDLGGGLVAEPRKGAWPCRRLLKAQILDSWGIISIETNPKNSFQVVMNMIMSVGTDMGMAVSHPKMATFNVRIMDLMRVLETVRDKKIGFLFVIISAQGRDYYHRLKRIAERDVGVLTQCIKEFTATRKMTEQTMRNIMLKVNSKLMGTNHALDIRSTPKCLQQGKIMLVGADVTHPSPDQSSVPSIAAVTASIDPKFTLYNITLSVQTPKKEMIVDFEDMMVEHLHEFEKRQNDLPNKIYVFRDGVSEGQFAQVMNSELQAIHNAYRRRTGHGSRKRPEVLFLLVQKRHHTRLFLGDSVYNVDPGTVVDSQIVHQKELDFYLVSHQAIKGTARPTRYHAVCNDGGISQEEVEQLTYYLCHLFARCSRSVSYPTPTYYAHLACMRARSLTYGDKFSNADLEKAPQRLRVLERILESSRMFFV